jgi:lysophospholipase L1-like esterase
MMRKIDFKEDAMPTRFRKACARPLLAGAIILLLGCDSSTGGSGSSAGAPGSGGVTGTGGAAIGGSPVATGGTSTAAGSSGGGLTSTGGPVTSGGVVTSGGASGGTAATDSTTTTGGAGTSGGTIASGGVASSGGASGGTNTTGGTPVAGSTATGGASAIGGTTGAGGTKSTGGTSMGGVPSTGGSKITGGTTATGGTSVTGGSKITGGTTATGGATGSTGPLSALTIYIAGDSTVSTYADTAATNDWAGWGQMLHEIFNDKVTVQNRAAGGRTAYWFYLEGAVDKILSTIKPGDYFLIQFGTNDSNQAASFTVNGTTYPRYAAADTTFKTQLKQYYLDPTKAKGAIPVLVTPPPRNSAYCNGANGLGAYDTAMIELGTAENVAVVDLGGMTFDYLKAICPKPTTAATETFFKNNTGTIDGTHFQENGARKMAGFIGEAIRTLKLELAAYLL